MTPTPYRPDELSRIRRDVRSRGAAGDPIECPVCGATLNIRGVAIPDAVSYVRDRIRVVCPGCDRAGAVDRLPDDPDARRPGSSDANG